MVIEDWTLQVISKEPIDSWEEAARVLRGLLDAVGSAVAREYGASPSWSNEDMGAEAWQDLDRITANVLDLRHRDEEGRLWEELGSSGIVQGYLPGHGRALVNLRYTLRSNRNSAQCHIEFWAAGRDAVARPLDRHPPEWLVYLACSVGAAVRADQVRVYTRSLSRALRTADPKAWFSLGAVSLAPSGLDTSGLPASLTAYDCPMGYPQGTVVVADLRRVVDDPASLVGDLLVLDDALARAATQRNATR